MLHLYDTNNHVRKRYEVDTSGLVLRNLYNEAFHVPDPMIFVFDGKDAKDARRQIYPEYKAGRPPTPDNFYVTMDIFKELLSHTGKCSLILDGYEADDIIATLVRSSPETEITIHSNDGDYLALCNEWVKMSHPPKLSDKCEFKDIRLYKTLIGDPGDYIKGIKNFGPKGWNELGDIRKANWAGWLDRNPWTASDIAPSALPDPAELGLTDKQYLWACENQKVLRGYWAIVNFVNVDNDLMMSKLRVGVPNYPVGNSLLQEILQ